MLEGRELWELRSESIQDIILKATHLNNPDYQFILGWEFYMGTKVETDEEKAIHWWFRASEQGHPYASYYLGCYVDKMTDPKSQSMAAALYYRAAKGGHYEAMHHLAICLITGQGFKKDYKEALNWLNKALVGAKEFGDSQFVGICEQSTKSLLNKFKTVMFSKIAGITFDDRQVLAKQCYVGMPLSLRRERDNKYDANAVAIKDIFGRVQYGYIPRQTAVAIASLIDAGNDFDCYVEQVNVGPTGIIGINIRIVEKP